MLRSYRNAPSALTFVLMLYCGGLQAQDRPAPLPTPADGDAIAFIGNSITHDGRYHTFLQLYLATRYPEVALTFYNAGISGDVAGGMLDRFDEDILRYPPDHAFVMVGMNDINRSLYGRGITDADTLRLRREILDTYALRTDSLVRRLIGEGIAPVLFTPSIYDQTGSQARENLFGANDALGYCAELVRALGRKYDVPVVDFFDTMSAHNAERQRLDSTYTIVGADRIHPGDEGHLLMARQLIDRSGERPRLARLHVDWEDHRVIDTVNARILAVAGEGNQTLELTVSPPLVALPRSRRTGFAGVGTRVADRAQSRNTTHPAGARRHLPAINRRSPGRGVQRA